MHTDSMINNDRVDATVCFKRRFAQAILPFTGAEKIIKSRGL